MNRMVIAIIIIAFTAGARADDKTAVYHIRFQRPHAAGEKYLIAISSTDKNAMTATSNGEVLNSRIENSTTRMDALCAVLEVTPAGGLKKDRYEISRFTVDRGDGEREMLPRNAVVTATRGGEKPVFEVNGTPAGEAVSAALGQVISGLTVSDRDDAVFGTAATHAIGGCWPIDAARAVEELGKGQIVFKKESVTGSMCLDKAITRERIPSFVVKGWMEIRDVSYPAWDMEIIKSRIRIDVGGVFPVDESKQCLESRLAMNMSISGKKKSAAGEPDILVEVSSSQEVTMHISYR